ncbi:SMP-30/gluconolactonase/LRE family protein [Reichenbachiella sp. MALMAid0571]|uniref:SMP-30/gluconolactonase/LRE family protein n=1 Tax=Reichenbachiella sp. MALMAid0571 TaxID=3143939 RepID=UPI0032DEFC61
MKKKFVIIFLLGIIYFTGSTIIDSGTFKTIENKFTGEVTTIYNSMSGTEDMAIDRERGLLFISSSDRWSLIRGEKAPNDGIYLLQIDSGTAPVKLETTYSGDFHPHGISFFEQNGESFLYAVNHNNQGDYVEAFKFENNQLTHIRTFENETMNCPNDLVVVDKHKFYVTNDHGNKEGVMRTMEDYLKIPSSYLLYYDGEKFSKAYDGLNYANGVAVSHDGRKLYLTHTTARELLTFNRNPDTGFLEVESTLKLGTGVDNINIDEKGNIWVGAHPKLFAFVEHAGNPAKKSPSEVLKVTPHGAKVFGVEKIYLNSGEELSGSSVAVTYKGEIFIGAVFEKKLLRGRLK